MADPFDPTKPGPGADSPDAVPAPYAQEPAEVEEEAPRPPRAASARFIVDAEVGSDALLRDAMDPANQSLAEALRLSFRVLQAVILVLVVLFLVSGFQTVKNGQSGVRTVWGKIVTVDGAEALTAGLKFSVFPRPIGEFILFEDENRPVNVTEAFVPSSVLRATQTFEQLVQSAETSGALTPGRDGSLLTRDGDLSHLEFTAKYRIDGIGQFVRCVNDSDKTRDADHLVRMALQRAAVHAVAASSLEELIDLTEEMRGRIQQSAQQLLDGLKCGIQLTQVQIKSAYAPLAIQKSMGDLQAARVQSGESIQKANQKANETLTNIAGSDHKVLTDLIEQYEDALAKGQEQESAELRAAINDKLDHNDGAVAQIVQSARTYQGQIEMTLGNESRRFTSLLPAYRSNPQLLVRQQWLEAFSKVLSRPDVEVFYVPDALMSMTMTLSSSAAIQELRRKNNIERRSREADTKGYDPLKQYQLREADINLGKAGRQLGIKDNKAVPKGTPN